MKRMKFIKSSLMAAAILAVLAVFIGVLPAMAGDVPAKVNYQARLTDSSGVPIDSLLHDLRFTVMDADTTTIMGGPYTYMDVTINNGLVNLQVALTASNFSASGARYLKVEVGNGDGTDPTLDSVFEELLPRQQLVSVPYAFEATSAATATALAGGEIDPKVDTEAKIETITGAYFGTSKAVTLGNIWIADGTDFESCATSGDVTVASGGAMTIGVDKVKDTHIDWGSATGQVDLDDIPNSATYVRSQNDFNDTHLANLTSNTTSRDRVKTDSGDTTADYLMNQLARLNPSLYNRDIEWQLKGTAVAADRYTLQTPNRLAVDIGGAVYFLETQAEIVVSTASREGKDLYIYASVPASGSVPDFVVSLNSALPATIPSGATPSADNTRKIGGFHCLCVAVGAITGHSLTGFAAGDVLPASIWDIEHRPSCSPEGMVYSEAANIWVDIYLASGTGASTASVYNATTTDSRDWMDFVDDGGAVGKRMLKDGEFQLIAAGSNEETNITGSADPVTTGGHVDTASRRMISNIGAEDCCGAWWQWLAEQSYRMDGLDLAASQAWAWYNLAGIKGSLYKQGTYGDVKLIAGGSWGGAANAGSRSRGADGYRWAAAASIGCRFGAEPK